MIDSKQVLADFQFLGNRVSKFNLETKNIEQSNSRATLSFDFDYNILGINEQEDRFLGLIDFIVVIKAKIKNTVLFKIHLNMEGAFIGNKKKLSLDNFRDMLELNGLTTLSQLSRAYVLSVTSLSGINPSIKLPMINIRSLIEKKKKKKEDKKND